MFYFETSPKVFSISLDISRYSFGAALPKCLPLQNSHVSGKGVLSNRRAPRDLITGGLVAKLIEKKIIQVDMSLKGD